MTLLDHTFATPAENLAADEVLLDVAEAGTRAGEAEALRFWESPGYFVVVGYANRIAREVNEAACAAVAVPVLRRCSGGGTVLQGPGCLNYALVLHAAEGTPLASITRANQFIMERNRAALERLLGRPMRIQGHTDLTVDGRKFSGNAQRRRRRFVLFHGTFLLDFDLSRIGQLLGMPSWEPDYRAHRGHEEFVMNLGLSRAVVKAALAEAWSAQPGASRPPEAETRRLAESRYARDEWNRRF